MEVKEKKNQRGCKDEAMFWLEYGDRTEKEMVQHLRKKGYEEWEIAECMEFLIECSFIDDERYALKFVGSSMEKGRGPVRIRHELQEKGIPAEIAEEAVRTVYDRTTEKEIAWEVAQKAAWIVLSGREPGEKSPALTEKEKAKIARKLASAGFSAGAAYDAIHRLI